MDASVPAAPAGRSSGAGIARWRSAPPASSEPSEAVFSWLVRLRWLAIAGVAVVLVSTGPGLGLLPRGAAPALWWVLAALALYNAALALLGPGRGIPWASHFAGQIVADCLALALLVHFAGGVENPFLPFFALHVVNANIVLGRRAASAVLGVAVALLALIVLGEGSGWLAHHCLEDDPQACRAAALGPGSLGTLAGLLMTLVAGSYFARYLTARLQQSERRLEGTVAELSIEKERLAESRATIDRERSRLQAIIDCIPDAVTFSDPQGRVLLSNEQARELRRAAEPGAGTDPLGAGALRTLFLAVTRGPAGRSGRSFERGGRSYEETSAVVLDWREAPLGLVTVTRDVTDRLGLERRLMDDERMAVVGKLAAAVAHEINNPIGVVSLYAQHALAKLPPGSPLEKHLAVIRRNAESCRKIIGDLLELARPRTPERRPVDLRALCTEVAQSLEPFAERSGVLVAGQASAAAPLWTEGDADQLRQAVLNLALNAVEASSEGDRVSIRAYETQDLEAPARVVEVSDTGAGIAPDRMAHIFQPFFTTKSDGTGLGLAVADNIVKGHAGRIVVQSSQPHGTVFRILLPVGGRAADRRAPGWV